MSLIIALAIFGSLSAMTAAGPRVYYAMARDGIGLPGFDRLGRRGRAPIVAILVQAIIGAALALTGAFSALLTYIGSALLLFAGLAVAAVYRVRRQHSGADETTAGKPFRVPGYPVVPAIFLVVVAATLVNGLIADPRPTGAALLTVLAGGALYALGRRQGWLTPRWQE